MFVSGGDIDIACPPTSAKGHFFGVDPGGFGVTGIISITGGGSVAAPRWIIIASAKVIVPVAVSEVSRSGPL